MNIIYIDHYAGSKDYGRSFRPHYLGREWVGSGHNVTVVAGSYSHLRAKQPVSNSEVIDGVEYIWLKTPRYNGNGLGRILSMFVFVLKLFLALRKLKKRKPDVIIASTVYMLDCFPAWILKKITRAKLIFELHDLWPASPKELGGYSSFHPFILAMSFAEKMAYKLSDRVVSILPLTYSHAEKFGVKEGNWHHVPNGIVAEEWDDLGGDVFSLPMIDNDAFTVGYAGQIGLANSIDVLVKAAHHLKSENIQFIVIGDGPEKEKLEAEAKDLKLNNIFFVGRISKKSIPSALKAMDALYVGLPPTPLFQYGISPNKIFDYMMSGRPIIQAIDAGNDLVLEAQCGVSVKGNELSGVLSCINELKLLSSEQRDEMGQNGKEFVLKNHNYRQLAKKFIKALK